MCIAWLLLIGFTFIGVWGILQNTKAIADGIDYGPGYRVYSLRQGPIVKAFVLALTKGKRAGSAENADAVMPSTTPPLPYPLQGYITA
jgi:hypothetical protein